MSAKTAEPFRVESTAKLLVSRSYAASPIFDEAARNEAADRLTKRDSICTGLRPRTNHMPGLTMNGYIPAGQLLGAENCNSSSFLSRVKEDLDA
jgi:hypothetical protein